MPSSELPHVLVVGDDADLTLSICQTLDGERFRCSGASGSHEALAVARRSDVDVALLDVSGLAAADGLKLAAKLRYESRDLGVVLIAANRSLEDLIEALRLGIVDFLAKPVSHGELTDAVNRAMEWRDTVQQSRGALAQYEDEIADGAVRIGTTLTAAAISSSRGLQQCLDQMYGPNVSALEHARRVAVTTIRLSHALDIAEPLLGHIKRAALLHDIGKLAIPRAIIRKAWPLSSGEHAVVRSHVRVAEEALACVPYLSPTAEIVGATRERMDGRGYPRRLRGGAIPIGARIIAVAEAFDSLSGGTDTPLAQSVDAANAQLVRHSGSWFDPQVVNAWLRCQDQARAAASRAEDRLNSFAEGGPATPVA
ncbi:MAG: HD domain-containing phosphohydrolase [Vicinamibacterales bacterium]